MYLYYYEIGFVHSKRRLLKTAAKYLLETLLRNLITALFDSTTIYIVLRNEGVTERRVVGIVGRCSQMYRAIWHIGFDERD